MTFHKIENPCFSKLCLPLPSLLPNKTLQRFFNWSIEQNQQAIFFIGFAGFGTAISF